MITFHVIWLTLMLAAAVAGGCCVHLIYAKYRAAYLQTRPMSSEEESWLESLFNTTCTKACPHREAVMHEGARIIEVLAHSTKIRCDYCGIEWKEGK